MVMFSFEQKNSTKINTKQLNQASVTMQQEKYFHIGELFRAAKNP